MDLIIGKVSNSELTKLIIKDIPGITYYSNFLTNKYHQQIMDVLDTLDYRIVNGRPTKYFGVNYSHRKRTHDSIIEELPDFFNLLKPIGYNFDQLVIEYFRPEDGHNYISESDLFDKTVIILPIGSHFKYSFSENDRDIEFLVEPGSLLVVSNKWKRSIRHRLKEKFNGYSIDRKEFYLLTYRNIKSI